MGDSEKALAYFIKGTELEPRSTHPLYNLAETYTLLRDYPNGERCYDRAISLSPDFSNLYNYKALMYVCWDGVTERAWGVLEKAKGRVSPSNLAFTEISLHLFDRNFRSALERLSEDSNEAYEDQMYFLPKSLIYATVFGLMDQSVSSQVHYDSTRSILESIIIKRPDDTRLHSSLGIAYAGLGRKQDAIREGKLAVKLLPVSKEALVGPYRVKDLAQIHTMVGEYDAAIDQLEFLLSIPGEISVPLLRIDPIWDPLRSQPRFKKLLE